GYTICSGSHDKTIRMWDIETTKQLNVFKGHTDFVRSVKYGSNELINTILSGSFDKSICLWDIRSCQSIQEFYGHRDFVNVVEYSPFVIKNSEFGGNSNVICSGSSDNTISFWDIRSNKEELYIINGNCEDKGIICVKFLQLKRMKRKEKAMMTLAVVLICVTVHMGGLFVFIDKEDILLTDFTLNELNKMKLIQI
ncbi:G-protein beta WD-40 repeats containing protein, partial [Reticulomyxa filosa]